MLAKVCCSSPITRAGFSVRSHSGKDCCTIVAITGRLSSGHIKARCYITTAIQQQLLISRYDILCAACRGLWPWVSCSSVGLAYMIPQLYPLLLWQSSTSQTKTRVAVILVRQHHVHNDGRAKRGSKTLANTVSLPCTKALTDDVVLALVRPAATLPEPPGAPITKASAEPQKATTTAKARPT